MEKYFTIGCGILVGIMLLSATIGYFFAESRTRDVYTQISAETLSKMFEENPIESQNLIGQKYTIEVEKVDSIICFEGKYITLIDCGAYPQIYVEYVVLDKSFKGKVNVKLKEYKGFIVATAII